MINFFDNLIKNIYFKYKLLFGEHMSGHSKWSNIKHKKAAADAKRGKLFTRLSKEISIAARANSDPTANPRLRQLIEKARDLNMPMDNVTRAIKRGTGELPGVSYESHLYEGYGPHGIAVIIEVLTDNKNRTVADIRRIFTSTGGSLAESGAVSWMFKKMGVVRTKEALEITEDQLLEALIDFEVHDMYQVNNAYVITCSPQSLEGVKNAVHALQIPIESADLEWIAQNTVTLSGEQEEKAINFLQEVEEHDDVQDVYTNLA